MPTKESILKYGEYKDALRVCKQCGKSFYVENWRHQAYCSVQCGINSHKGHKMEERICLYCKKPFQAISWKKTKYCSFECSVDANRGKARTKIAKCAGEKIRHRSERKLKDGRRISLHRYLMELSIGRILLSTEQVHHIDMDNTNNNFGNFYLYENARKHTQGHKSIEKLVKGLLKDKIIGFGKGKYFRKVKGEKDNG